ncbi:MAG: ribosome biogenesis GTPase Der [Candidatus Omnitrophota bacterium]|nr:ribosome biogenesis GTPase Der [Candidatus Omnitrophota bacterium]
MENFSSIPTISIVGRPNVGKSSLFNCLLGERRAVVVEQSGTTRDRVEAIITLSKVRYKLVDTGGYVPEDRDELSSQIKDHILRAMEEAFAIILVVDTIAGISPLDKEMAVLLRKFSKTVILVANKIDNERLQGESLEFYQLGFGEPVEVSCLHRRGLRELKRRLLETGMEEIEAERGEGGEGDLQTRYLKIAVVGRPNVGKSSFVNCLLARNRVIVSPVPGTTRDSVDTHFSYEGDEYILIDTAGIRHRRKIKTAVDIYSVMRSRESIKRADVGILLLDAADGITKDDMGIIDYIEENGKACLILVNKWDLGEDTAGVSADDYKKHLVYASGRIRKFPVAFVSSKTGKNVLGSLSLVKILDSNLDLKVSTPFLNRIFEKNDPSDVPIPRRKKRPNFLYTVQSGHRPVEFTFFVSEPAQVLPAHLSFVENQLRDNLPLKGIPVKIRLRRSRKGKK